MSLFKRKPRTEARAALKDPVFATTAPGADHLHIDYDPADWLRCPTVGVDRTAWVTRAMAAYAADLGWTPGTDAHGRLEAALNAVANDDLSATATFVSFTDQAKRHILATVKLLDDELMTLEYGGPTTFLTFDNDPSRPPTQPQTFLKTFQWAGRGGYDDQGNYVRVFHAHRSIDTEPLLHLAGTCFRDTPRGDIGPFASLFYDTHVHLDDGRVL